MVLEISMYFEEDPYRNFGTISLSHLLIFYFTLDKMRLV